MRKSKSDKSEARNQPLAGLVGNYFSRTSVNYKNDDVQSPIEEIDSQRLTDEENVMSEAGFQPVDEVKAYK